MAPGTSVKLGLIHEGQERTVTLTLGTLPNEKQAANQPKQQEVPDSDVPKLGLTLAPGKADGGVVVTAVDPNGVAAEHGFQVGDVILDISGKSVGSPGDVRKQIADARKQGKRTVLFRVKSNAGTRFVALPLGNA
jgi:serine protease Do